MLKKLARTYFRHRWLALIETAMIGHFAETDVALDRATASPRESGKHIPATVALVGNGIWSLPGRLFRVPQHVWFQGTTAHTPTSPGSDYSRPLV